MQLAQGACPASVLLTTAAPERQQFRHSTAPLSKATMNSALNTIICSFQQPCSYSCTTASSCSAFANVFRTQIGVGCRVGLRHLCPATWRDPVVFLPLHSLHLFVSFHRHSTNGAPRPPLLFPPPLQVQDPLPCWTDVPASCSVDAGHASRPALGSRRPSSISYVHTSYLQPVCFCCLCHQPGIVSCYWLLLHFACGWDWVGQAHRDHKNEDTA